MSYCKNCEITYKTSLEKCLICGDNLEHEENLSYNYQAHKHVSPIKKYFLKAFILLNIISILVTLTIDYIDDSQLYFSLIVSLCNLYLIIFLNLLFNHYSVIKKLFTSIFLGSTLIVLIGILIKDYHWAIDIVLPFLFISNTLMLTITLFVKRNVWQEYALFLILSVFSNILIVLLNVFNISNTSWAITVSFFYGISTLLGLFIFTPKDIKEEFLRRLHI